MVRVNIRMEVLLGLDEGCGGSGRDTHEVHGDLLKGTFHQLNRLPDPNIF